ncbi:MAG: O-antigen ligase family protein [Hyphomicrobiaceae bacterium]|nr:O-antigen ligase family protein [Hyphomicrobiaceae bacterium]
MTVQTARHPMGGTAGLQRGRQAPASSVVDRYAILLALPFCYVSILLPVAAYSDRVAVLVVNLAPNIADRVFWPAYALLCFAVALRDRARLAAFLRAPHVRPMIAYMLLAGASVLWAVKPEFVLTRIAGQTFILLGLCSMAAVAPRQSNLARALFLAFAFGALLNGIYVAEQSSSVNLADFAGFRGYFGEKNGLGFFSAFAFLLALTQARGSKLNIALVIAVLCGAAYLLIISRSKGALAFAIASPALAWLLLKLHARTRIPPAAFILVCVALFFLLNAMVGNLVSRISWYVYGNPTLSNRTVIWDFVSGMSTHKPWLGFGYRAFWLVSSDLFGSIKAPEWVKVMPHGHNGYLDVRAELGYAGILILAYFLIKVCNMLGEVARVDYWRAWYLLTIAVFVMLINLVESSWFRGADPIWMIFMFVVVETGRAWVSMKAERRPLHPPAPQLPAGQRPVRGMARAS